MFGNIFSETDNLKLHKDTQQQLLQIAELFSKQGELAKMQSEIINRLTDRVLTLEKVCELLIKASDQHNLALKKLAGIKEQEFQA